MKYRAFGAVKSMTYGNNKELATQFDARLRLKRWDVAGVLGYDYSYDKFAENSFRVTYAQNISHNGAAGGDAGLNRSYDYDQAMFRQYHGGWARFDQPDPSDGFVVGSIGGRGVTLHRQT